MTQERIDSFEIEEHHMEEILIPQIRFSEFNENWEKIPAGEIFKNFSNKKHDGSLPILAVTQDKGVVFRDELDFDIKTSEKSVKSYKVIEPGDFVISLRSFQGGIEYSYIKGICSPAYTILKPKREIYDDFYKFYLKKEEFISRLNYAVVGIRDGKQISYKDFSEIKIPYTNKEEQKRVAEFLNIVEKKISLLENMLILYKNYKKQLVFDLTEYDNQKDWKKYKLKELLEEYSEKSTINNQFPVLSSTKEGIKPQLEYFNRNIASNDNVGYKIIHKNQLVLSPQNLWLGNININDEFEIGIVSPSYKIYDLTDKSDVNYLKHIIKKPKMLYLFENASEQGASVVRRNLNKELFENIEIYLPPKSEQEKIGSFLNNLDKKIKYITRKKEEMILFKKGLLQKMFV